MRRHLPTSVLVCVAAALSVWVWACTSTPTGPSSGSTVSGFLSGAIGLGASSNSGTPHSGTPPAPTTGPTATASGNSGAANSGASLVSVTGSSPFQTVFVSVGGVPAPILAASEGVSLASTVTPDGFLEIDLASPVTSLPISIGYVDLLPTSSFDLVFQLAAAGGATGPIATEHKTVAGKSTIVIIGVVLAAVPGATAGPTRPVAGAVVSTTLDSVTATTDANGAFDLQTNTPTANGKACYAIIITAQGQPTFSERALWGDRPINQVFNLSQPATGASCGADR